MRLATILLPLIASALPLTARPPAAVGICLVALQPNSPDEEVGGILYCGSARTCCSYILRTPQGMKINVADNRFRGLVKLPTLQSMRAQTPERELARMEALAKRYPLAVSSFSSQLEELRQLVDKRQVAATVPVPPATPGIRIGGKTYHDFELRALSEGRAIFRHRNGVASLPLESLTKEERSMLHKLAAEKSSERATPAQ